MSKRQNHLNPSLPYSNVNAPFTGIIPDTRYDVTMGPLADNTNPYILVVDSNDRDYSQFPNPNQYNIKLDPPYKEVTSVELVVAKIPDSNYVVDTPFNLIYFQETDAQVLADSYLTAEVPVGNRDISNICTQIETQMNLESVSGATYTCAVNSFTNLITITQTVAGTSDLFNLSFAGTPEKTSPPNHQKNGVYTGNYRTPYRERSIGPMIGFDREDYTDAVTYTGTFVYNLNIERYVVVFINKTHTTAPLSRVDSLNSNIRDAFCIIPLMNSNTPDFEYIETDHNFRYVKYFPQPVTELAELKFEFRDQYGNLFNFNGLDHTMVFEIHSSTRNNVFSDARGASVSTRRHN